MWPSTKYSWKYKELKEDQEDDGSQATLSSVKPARHRRTLLWTLTWIAFAAGAALGFCIQNNNLLNKLVSRPTTIANTCSDPAMRREWRSLSSIEKQDYIEAVQCLSRQPSKVRDNGTLYDDFPWIHRHYGAFSHGAASFLSWHRYLIHLYERTLREDCGYRGHLTYWDWTLDSEDLTKSPIWDSKTGFGGDGDPNGVEIVGKGRCVIDGPFANLRPLFFNSEDNPHCLSRGFWDGHKDGSLPGANISSKVIEKILAKPDYTSFFLALEHGPHNVIPNAVRGDFLRFTAPSDPVFFLHHTQLDRIWWLWQMRNPMQRLTEYTGNASSTSGEPARLNDRLPVGGFAPDIEVKEVTNTQSGLLCYAY